MRKNVIANVVIVLLIVLGGCSKANVTETKDVKYSATVVSVDKSSSVHYVGGIIQHDTVYKTVFRFDNGEELTVNRADVYEECKDKIGARANISMTFTYYDNGEASYKINGIDLFN